jgi:hypothetical protein
MALWGKSDDIFSPGTVSVNYGTKVVTGSGTSFVSASVGDVISIGTFGKAIISEVTSQTQVSIATTQWLSGAAISGQQYTISQQPKYLLQDTNYSDTYNTSVDSEVYGVDVNEAASAVNTQYAVAHAGWVGVHTYVDMHGNLRVKSETLVAMSGITDGTTAYGTPGDSADDTTYPDRLITITSQPSAVGIATTGTGTFSVTATVTPTAALSYQWQVSTNGGTSYSSATGGIYSNETTATLTITNPPSNQNNNLYRVQITSTGGASATSSAAKLTVTA